MTGNFQLQFRWVTDGDANTGSTGNGCWVDYLDVIGTGGTNADPTEIADGTSFSAPYVSGAAAFLLGAMPTLTVPDLKTFLMNAGDARPDFQGTTVSGNRLNLYRALKYRSTALVAGLPSGVVQSTTATGTVSGYDVAAYQWRLDGAAYSGEIAPSQPISLSGLGQGVHTVDVLGKDSNGNWQDAAYPTSVSWTIDSTPPTATISYSPSGPTKVGVVATLHPSEAVTVTNNYGISSKYFYTNGSFTFTFVDAVGLTGSATATVTTIDTKAPIGTVTYSLTTPTANAVVATLNANEPVSMDYGQTTNHTFTANGFYYFYFHDLAGNYGTATAVVSNILSQPRAAVSLSTLQPTLGPVTATFASEELSTIENNGGRSTLKLYRNGSFSFLFHNATNKSAAASTTITNIINPVLTNFLTVTKGVFTTPTWTGRPFKGYTDIVVGRKVSFSSLGSTYLFMPFKSLSTGAIAVYNGAGKKIQTLTPPDSLATKGLSAALVVEPSVNRAHLAVSPNSNGSTVVVYEVTPAGLKAFPKLTASSKIRGPVVAVFKRLFGNQIRLVTYINNDLRTIRVWRYNVQLNQYVPDSTYKSKHFTLTNGKLVWLSSVYGQPAFVSPNAPKITLTAPVVNTGLVTFTTTVDRQADVSYEWGPTPDFGNAWTYNNFPVTNFAMAIPSPAGSTVSFRVKACLPGTTTCTITPVFTYPGK